MTNFTFSHHLKAGILLFWSIWFSVVTATNICDALKALDVLPDTWTFASGNLAYMRQVTAIHHTPALVVSVMFLGVVLWELLASVLHWRAFLQFRAHAVRAAREAQRAFVVSTALWGAFMIADELFISYDVEAAHFRIFIAELVSIAVLTLVHDWHADSSSHAIG